MKVRNKALQCLVDSGSVSSVISHTLVSKLCFKISEPVDGGPLITANGERLNTIGTVDIIFHLKGLQIPHTFIVIQGLHPNIILGSDFLRANHASICYADNTVRFYDDLIVVPLQGFMTTRNCAVIHQTTCIPRFAEAVLSVKLPSTFTGTEVLLEPLKSVSDVVAVAGSISDVRNGIAKVKVLNYRPNSITLKRGFKLTTILYPAAVLSISKFKTADEVKQPMTTESLDVLEQFAKDYKLDVNPNLSVEDRQSLLNTLYNYRDVLARSYKDLKIHKGYQLDIDLKDPTCKSYTRQYPLPKADAEEADRQILELLEQGLISENDDCSFNSPCFLINKKSGEKRLLVDLRKVNSLIKPLIVTLPRIEQLLQEATALKGKIYSSADMYKGYYQLQCRRNNHVTGFVSPKTGISYKFNVAPMGLSTSPAAFIHAMSNVFKDRNKFNFLLLYVDDIVLISKTMPEHVKHLRTLCETLRANDLVLNPTKTSVAYPNIDFLGYNISQNGIKISESKVKAIKSIQAPQNQKSLLRLIGFLNYFKKHLPNFTRRTYNIRQLLKKDSKFVWSAECQAELEDLKLALIENPVLQPLQPDREVYLYTDASSLGLASVLLQFDDNNIPHACAYLSQTTTESQRRTWCPYQLEMAALGISLKTYESLLLHQQITVFTDSAIVLNLARYKPVNAREKRLLAYLSQFHLNIKFIPGHQNKVADCLSRIQEDMNSEQAQILRPSDREDAQDFILAINDSAPTVEVVTETDLQSKQRLTMSEKPDIIDYSETASAPGEWIAYSFQPLPPTETMRTVNSVSSEANALADSSELDDEQNQNILITPSETHMLNVHAPIFQPRESLSYVLALDGQQIVTAPDMIRRSQRLIERRQKQQQASAQLAQSSLSAVSDCETICSDKIAINQNVSTSLDAVNKHDGHTDLSVDTTEQSNTTSQILSDWAKNNSTLDFDRDSQDLEQTSTLLEQLTDKLTITSYDYLTDEEFSPIYNYLVNDILTGDDKVDRKTLLLVENYYTHNELLYKLSLPRGRKQKRIELERHQLCIPRTFRESLVKQYHELLGHNGVKKMHIMLIKRYFWRDMLKDIMNVVKHCDICQCSKIVTNRSISPLNPIPTPIKPFQCVAMDHRALTRKTEMGNTHVLTFICHFSGYIIYVPVSDETAFTSAQAFVKEVVARHGICDILISDKGAGFMSIFFDTVAKLLNIRHRTSAVQSSRTNGMAEMAIKKLNQGLKLYSSDDIDDTRIELILPLIEMGVRASPLSNIKISPFEILHGVPMNLPIPINQDIPNFASRDAESYARWLKNALRLLHDAVRCNRIESKQEMKAQYDRYHKVKFPTFQVGDVVYMKDTRVKPNSPRVLTHRPYSGPFIIRDVVQYNDTVGPAYKLVHAASGKIIKRLVNVDKLKKCPTDAEKRKEQPENKTEMTNETARNALVITDKAVANNGFLRGLYVLKDRWKGNRRQYLVLRTNNTVTWCDHVGPGLLLEYRRKSRR